MTRFTRGQWLREPAWRAFLNDLRHAPWYWWLALIVLVSAGFWVQVLVAWFR